MEHNGGYNREMIHEVCDPLCNGGFHDIIDEVFDGTSIDGILAEIELEHFIISVAEKIQALKDQTDEVVEVVEEVVVEEHVGEVVPN